jgi:SAM-dependent methyltransferase
MLRFAGKGVACPCCRREFREMAPAPDGRPNVLCPSCGSHERHRLLAFFLSQEMPDLCSMSLDVLHFAPEPYLEARLRCDGRLRYISADLDAPEAMCHFDIQDMPFADDRFDLVVCSHVLEHVPDDRKAVREIARTLRPAGRALILVPMDVTRARTHEDASITSAEDRRREFWQEDHFRVYGNDVVDRLSADGLRVLVDKYMYSLDLAVVARHAMGDAGMFVCTVD